MLRMWWNVWDILFSHVFTAQFGTAVPLFILVFQLVTTSQIYALKHRFYFITLKTQDKFVNLKTTSFRLTPKCANLCWPESALEHPKVETPQLVTSVSCTTPFGCCSNQKKNDFSHNKVRKRNNTVALTKKEGRSSYETQNNALRGREEEEIKCTRKDKNKDQIRFYCCRATTGWRTDAALASSLLSVSSNRSALWFWPACFARFCRRPAGLNDWKESDHFSLCSESAVNRRRWKLWLVPVIKLMKHLLQCSESWLTGNTQHYSSSVFIPVMLFIREVRTSLLSSLTHRWSLS